MTNITQPTTLKATPTTKHAPNPHNRCVHVSSKPSDLKALDSCLGSTLPRSTLPVSRFAQLIPNVAHSLANARACSRVSTQVLETQMKQGRVRT